MGLVLEGKGESQCIPRLLSTVVIQLGVRFGAAWPVYRI